MKKLLGMLRVKTSGASSDEETKPEVPRKPEEADSDSSTKDKDSTSDEQREAKKEEIKRSMQDRRIGKFQKVLS
jgi:hypothetical protein